jgi:tripartite-type tricarboxylate transporter receptor subunit TctC
MLEAWSRRRWLGAALGGLAGTAGAQSASPPAMAWPRGKPVTVLVPFAAGGSLDGTTRLVTQQLAARWQHTVQVENATGAGGSIGMARAIAAPPDGATWLMAGDAPLVPGSPGETRYRHDVLRELIPTVLVNTAPMVLVTYPTYEANDFQQFISQVKARPGRTSYATSGVGTLPHLAMEMVKRAAGLHIVHIPYRGGAPIANDVAGKQIEFALLITASALPAIRSGLLKPLAVTGDKRLPMLPNVPAMAESPGFAGFNVVSWAGLYAPARTPTDIVQRMAADVGEVLPLDAVKGRLAEQGVFVQGGSPADFASFIERDRAQALRILQVLSLKE